MRIRAATRSISSPPRNDMERRMPQLPMVEGFSELYAQGIYRVLKSGGLTVEDSVSHTQRYLRARKELICKFNAFAEPNVFFSIQTADRTIDPEIYNLVRGFGFEVKLLLSNFDGVEVVRNRVLNSQMVALMDQKSDRRYAITIDPVGTSTDPRLIAQTLESLLSLAKLLASTVNAPPSKTETRADNVHPLEGSAEAA